MAVRLCIGRMPEQKQQDQGEADTKSRHREADGELAGIGSSAGMAGDKHGKIRLGKGVASLEQSGHEDKVFRWLGRLC